MPSIDERRRRDALERPVVGAARRQLLERRLPHELAVRLAERHQHAAIARLLRIAHRFVVRADEHDAAGDDRIAVALRSERRDPLDVLAGLDVPRRSAGPWRRTPCCDRASRPTSASRSRPLPRRTATTCADAMSTNADQRLNACRAAFRRCTSSCHPSARQLVITGSCRPAGCRTCTSEIPSRVEARRSRCGAGSCRSSRSSTRPARAGRPARPCPARASCRPARFSTRSFMRYQVFTSHVERHAHGHLVGGLPRMQLELLGVAEEHEHVALVDQADVAALAARSRCRARRLRSCSSTSRAGP